MSIIANSSRRDNIETNVSRYDQLNAALIAGLLLVGFLVSVLFLIWLTTIVRTKVEPPKAYVYEEPFGDEKPEGYEDDVLEPGVEEFPEVEKPQLKDALEAVTDAVSTVKAALERKDGDAAQMGKGRGVGSLNGGPGTGGGDIIPEYKRWKIEYEANSLDSYAQQLDYFKIYLGAVSSNSNDIVVIANVSGAPQARMSDRKTQGKVLRFSHQRPKMRRWDQSIARKAGVDLNGRLMTQFYPMETRQILRHVERVYLEGVGRELSEVRRTIFKVVPGGSGFEFKITKMLYRN